MLWDHIKMATQKEYVNGLQNKIIVCTFTTMKGYIKIFFLILISCCYVNTVFEFSDTEKKANFESESHTYIQQFDNQIFANSVTQSIPHFDINCNTSIQFHLSVVLSVSTKCISFYKNSFFRKRDKLFILYSSYLI